MHSHAQFNIIGRIGRVDVEEFQSDNKTRRSLVLAIATDDLRRKGDQGDPEPNWHRVACYVPHIIKLAPSLTPGRLVWLQGHIEQRTRGEGAERVHYTNLIAEDLGFLDPKAKAASVQTEAAE